MEQKHATNSGNRPLAVTQPGRREFPNRKQCHFGQGSQFLDTAACKRDNLQLDSVRCDRSRHVTKPDNQHAGPSFKQLQLDATSTLARESVQLQPQRILQSANFKQPNGRVDRRPLEQTLDILALLLLFCNFKATLIIKGSEQVQ